MDASILRAGVDEVDLVLGFVTKFHEGEGLDLTEEERKAAVRELIAHPKFGGIWLIFEDEVAIGYIALCLGFSLEFCGRDAFIDEFYIDTNYQYKGIGTWVMGLLKTEAQELGIRALHLEVAKTNLPARKLYENFGFEGRDKYLSMSVIL